MTAWAKLTMALQSLIVARRDRARVACAVNTFAWVPLVIVEHSLAGKVGVVTGGLGHRPGVAVADLEAQLATLGACRPTA